MASEWTTDTLHELLLALLRERDARYAERFTLSEKAVDSALASSERAVAKAEIATEKRFDAVNEFRAQLADQARDFMPRKEYEVQQAAITGRLNSLERTSATSGGRSAGLRDGWGYVVGAAGSLAGIGGLLFAIFKK